MYAVFAVGDDQQPGDVALAETQTVTADALGHASLPAGFLQRGALVDRYVIVDRVGVGGMGVVYAAYDPQLDRKVALKFLVDKQAGSSSSSGRERLIREAQAMAKLSHPNVVAVFDAGTSHGQVFIAMEFVEGKTLRAWLDERRRSWDEIWSVFEGAARGLAAAHDAGIIHRDFKPENVLVEPGGRARVTDFGLARASEAEAHRDVAVDSSATTGPLTRTGAILGTPRYMAPEQHLGQPTDEGSDQFSFCVALYEALYRERPFAGETIPEIAASVTGGRIREAPRGSSVPRWRRQILERGLSSDPAARWPSMEGLVDALDRDPGAQWRWIAGGVVVGVAVMVMLVAMGRREGAAKPQVCSRARDRLVDVWDLQRKKSVRAAFEAADPVYGVAEFGRVAGILDSYATSWVGVHTRACRATHVTGEQSDSMLDRRMRCLDRRLDELRATTELLSSADRKLVPGAIKMVRSLPSLDRCSDTVALLDAIPMPQDPALRQKLFDLEGKLVEASALQRAGRPNDAKPLVDAYLAEARELDFKPALGRALLLAADVTRDAGDAATAERLYREATLIAAEAKDDVIAARAWASLVGVLGIDLGKSGAALETLPMAEAAVARAGNDPYLRVEFLYRAATTLDLAGKPDEALAKLASARSIAEDRVATDPRAAPRLADILFETANVRQRKGDYEGNEDMYRRAIDIWSESLGPEHPDIAYGYQSLGEMYRRRADYDDAEASYLTAIAIREKRLGAEHPVITPSLIALATCYNMTKQYEKAAPVLERAALIDRKHLGANHPRVAATKTTQAMVLSNTGKTDEARAAYDEAIAILEAIGDYDINLPIAIYNRAELSLKTGDYSAALADYDRVVSMFEEMVGKEHAYLTYPLLGQGGAHIMLGAPARAIAPLQRALSIETPGDANLQKSSARWYLGRAIVEAGRGRAKGMALVDQARAELQAMEAQGESDLAALDKWLEANGR